MSQTSDFGLSIFQPCIHVQVAVAFRDFGVDGVVVLAECALYPVMTLI